ncbi:nacht and ankyrin domain-containing protein [Pochonia chlamydosporia 170]|uniref:Nacht and ankyrin domain-containing protein n=1 Tax=Pochonia chlamydosporia 170 TaxID=1380566 RepID=A0A179FQF3_METCM|nr:nacht and ankyrin domain-containing protein [Pochonia chlamydosporia 170]OAQ67814.1 nacht and ankyrin domain-containing protein [Pochonia chlamydosporia 170]
MKRTTQLPDPKLYTIGWITALEKELTVAIAVLDEKHEKPLNFTKHAKDTNSYAWGRIGEHNIVITSLAAGRYGTVSAATTAGSMMSSLPHLRFGLMVGIGAGIPRPNRDIRLGDVVVSHPAGTSGGVIQYDMGKLRSSETFERVGQLDAPPEVLLKRLQFLRAAHRLQGSRIPSILKEMTDEYPKLCEEQDGDAAFVYQGSHNDRLFEVTTVHRNVPVADNEGREQGRICAQCDDTEEIRRKDRRPQPLVHYGVIASGNCVVKDGISRDVILQRLEKVCICFEMEAAGLMNNIPCLVIRGICDYADTHKNDQWQNYAAATAAAFAKELLEDLDAVDVERTPEMQETIKKHNLPVEQEVAQMASINRETHNTVQQLETSCHYQELEHWLSPPNPSTNYNTAIKLRHEGSCQWLLNSERYRDWKQKGESTFLWLYGIPGCGKTVLASTVIHELQRDESARTILYFYFDFSDVNKQSFEKSLHSLVVQLYHKNENARVHLDALYKSHDKGKRQPSIHLLCETLQKMIRQTDNVYIVFDALDECRTRNRSVNEDLLTWMKALVQPQRTKLRLLVTSRPEQEIESAIKDWAGDRDILPIQSDLVAKDIRDYIHTGVHQNKGLERWRSRPDVQAKIEAVLNEKANGMFRWVTCQLDGLVQCLNLSVLEKELASLPKTLDETYARILSNLPDAYAPDTRRILQFLTFSERPLLIEEAVDAIAVDLDHKPHFNHGNRMPVPLEIARFCSSLVVLSKNILEGGQVVKELKLAHFSVQEYLMSDRLHPGIAMYLGEVAAKVSITQVCLAYLLELDQGLSKTALQRLFPMAHYAASYWVDHAVVAEQHSAEVRALIEEFSSCGNARASCYQLHDPDYPQVSQPRNENNHIASALYYMSLGGLYYSAQKMLRKGVDVNARGGRYGNALQAASWGGHEKIVKMLLENGANIHAQGGQYCNALHAASIQGHDRIVEMLLDNGADVNARDVSWQSALHHSVTTSAASCCRLLLSRGAEMDTDIDNMTPFHLAVSKNDEDIVKVLLDAQCRVDVRARRRIWRQSHRDNRLTYSPGRYIAQSKNVSTNETGLTALHFATLSGSYRMTKFLLDRHADPNAKSELGETPLHLALKQDLYGPKYPDFVDHWTDSIHRVEVSVQMIPIVDGDDNDDEYGETKALVDEQRLSVLKLLLAHSGIDPNAQDSKGASPLHCVRYGEATSRVAIDILVNRGAKISLRNNRGQSPLHLACLNTDIEAVVALLEYGASVTDVDTDGLNALHYASQGGNRNVLQYMLQALQDNNLEAVISSTDSQKRNVLHHLVKRDICVDPGALNLLCQEQVSAADLDNEGMSPIAIYLSQFSFCWDDEKLQVVSKLFEQGADPLQTLGSKKIGLGHLAAKSPGVNVELLRTLSEFGVDLHLKDANDGTILHSIAASGFLTLPVLRFLQNEIGLPIAGKDARDMTPRDLATLRSLEKHDPHVYDSGRWLRTKDMLLGAEST